VQRDLERRRAYHDQGESWLQFTRLSSLPPSLQPAAPPFDNCPPVGYKGLAHNIRAHTLRKEAGDMIRMLFGTRLAARHARSLLAAPALQT
jgi:hypothetical protein